MMRLMPRFRCLRGRDLAVGARRIVRSPRAARVALIVNPIAGLGGRVGLKGTDGEGTVKRARELGAVPVAPRRADEVVAGIADGGRRLGVAVEVEVVQPSSAEGTRDAAVAFRDRGVDLLLFVGGDGTARDVCAAVGTSVPVLGVPAGVKMHSGVFATGTRAAADVVVGWLASGPRRTREAEVVDIDEEAVREGRLSVRLYGTLLVPDVPGRIQALKAAGPRAGTSELDGLAAEVVRRLVPGSVAILGPGTTIRAVADRLGVTKTLLGVDVVSVSEQGSAVMIAADASEAQILSAIGSRPAVAVISPTGGQGFLLGRGNQQLSPAVLRAIGPVNVLVVASLSKLAALGSQPLFVDTGDAALDRELSGHRRVVTGTGQETVILVSAG
jgi:predicted polyphosphate/ATP-dependent NAD kinase